MKHCSSTRIPGAVLLSLILIHLSGFEAVAASGAEGRVQYVIMTDPTWDQYTSNPSPAMQQWFLANSWRIETFSPYFDSRLKWDPNAWSYLDLYAIYQGSPLLTAHPEWVLKDAGGNPLYIPWGCGGGTCPQYAADIANPLYRNWWIAQAQQYRTIGYKGLWIDDVNLTFDVGDGNGNLVAPIDSQTGQPMTYDNWRLYMAEFTEQIRAAFPGWEIVHNAVWAADTPTRTADSYIQREIAAANYINIERGVVDPGLTGGTWWWSLDALFNYIDAVHSLGTNVVLDNAAGSLNYALASYFLVSNGGDAVSSNGMMPNNWWNGFAVNLGSALNARTTWQGVYRRDFTGGMTLVNPPQSPSVTLTLPGTFYTVAGAAVTQVTLAAADGIVLLGSLSTGSFTLSPSPSAVSLTAGNGGTSTITVGSSNGFNSSVTFTVTGCPANATCGVSPSPVTPPSGGSTTTTLAVSTTPSTTPGTYKLIVGGNNGTQTTTVTLVVAGVPGFSLSANPGSLTVPAGSAGTSTITVGSSNGFNSSVNVAVTGCPANATCGVSPSPVTPPSGGSTTTTLAVSTTPSTTPGTYNLIVGGNNGTQTATVTLVVQAPVVQPLPDFSLSASPASLNMQAGLQGTSTITVGSVNGFNSAVNLSAGGCPANATCALSLSPVTPPSGGSATSILTVATTANTVPGVYTLTVGGNGGVHSTTLSLTVTAVPVVPVPVLPVPVTPVPVTPGPDFSLTSGGSLSLSPGYHGTAVLTLTSTGGFSGSVSTAITGCPTGAICFVPSGLTLSSGGVTSTHLSVQILWGVPAGNSTITITATSGSTVHSVQVPITVR